MKLSLMTVLNDHLLLVWIHYPTSTDVIMIIFIIVITIIFYGDTRKGPVGKSR